MRRRVRPEAIVLGPEVLDRVERVLAFHQTTWREGQSSAAEPGPDRPSPWRVFSELPATPLSNRLVDLPSPTLGLLRSGMAAIPESQIAPPQDLKTLSTWLHFSAGVTGSRATPGGQLSLRAVPSGGALYPTEIYVAAFALKDLESGLYHYSVREFALRKLRDGGETLHRLRRGRPDLEFLRSCPVAAIIASVFGRSAWRYGRRGYRQATLDAGHVVENLSIVATALGMRAQVRLRVPPRPFADLVGLRADGPTGDYEGAQALVAWTDPAERSVEPLAPAGGAGGLLGLPPALPPIARGRVCATAFDPALAEVHEACVSSGVAMVEVRPPLTELSVVPPDMPYVELPSGDSDEADPPLREVILRRRSPGAFARVPVPRWKFVELNRAAFLGCSHYPVVPRGPHAGLVRPLWVVNRVSGVPEGIWCFHPPEQTFHLFRGQDFHYEAAYLAQEQFSIAGAAAVCFLAASLRTLMTQSGPDVYRLAHLEAGAAVQRAMLAAAAMGLAVLPIGSFFDREAREFFGLGTTPWHILYGFAVGVADPQAPHEPSGV